MPGKNFVDAERNALQEKYQSEISKWDDKEKFIIIKENVPILKN